MAKKPAKARVHTFRKHIVTEGNHRTQNADGTITLKAVPRERLERMVNNATTLLGKGYSIPAPWKHDPNAVLAKLEEGSNGLLKDSTVNGGFWKKVEGIINAEGKYEVWGDIEVPGDPSDPKTPAGMVGTTVRETSIYLKGKHQLTDEGGEEIVDCPMHIALVTHAIEPGQGNFELKDDDMFIAMSQMEMTDEKREEDPISDGNLSELSELLASVAKVFLPTSTTMSNLVGNLILALNQMKLSIGSSGTGSGQPADKDSFTMEPIVMSKLTQEQLNALLAAKPVNPATGKPFTAQELSSESEGGDTKQTSELQDALNKMNLMMSNMNTQMADERQRAYRTRTNALIERGIITQDYATAHLIPQIEAYKPQVTEAGSPPSPVDTILMSLEAIPTPVRPGIQDNFTGSYEDVFREAGDMDEKSSDDLAAQMLAEIQ